MAGTFAILLVDADALALRATARVLQRAGYTVLQAQDGAGALRQAGEHRPSLVLVDSGLPDMSGADFVRRVRADAALEAVSVVLFSAQDVAPHLQADGLDSGADGYIVRPITTAELLARVRAHLRQGERNDGFRANQSSLRNLFERRVDAILVVDLHGMIRYANPAAGVLFNRLPGDLAGEPFGFPIVAGTRQEVQILDIPRHGQLAAMTEMHVIRFEWEGEQAWIATLHDITAHRTAELAVRESKALLDMATNVARLGAWSADVATGANVWSDSTRDILDAAPDVTLPFHETLALMVPEHRGLAREAFTACARHGTPFDIETEATTVKGRHIHLRSFGEAVRDETNRIVRMQGAFQDITDRKLSEQRVRDSERHFRELTEAMPMIVWTATPDGTVDYLNRRFFEYTECSPDAAPAQAWQQTLPQEDLDRLLPVWKQALLTGEAYKIEVRLRRGSDASFRWHLVQAVAIRTDTGAIVKWYGTGMDVHAARLLHEEAGHMNERLTLARDQAERANRAKSRFLAGMSHELRTPLSGMLGYAQLLHLEGGLTPAQSARVDAMLSAGTHLLEMINCVLDISQIEADRLALHPCAIDPRKSALACLDLVRPAAEAKGLTLHLVEASDVPRHMMADATRLRQVLLNLLGNAVKFTAHGSVEMRLRAATDGSGLRVEVADTGPGIPTAFRRQLFQDFERFGDDAGNTLEGAGLGLAISARLATLMGGELGHADNPGGGSVFWLQLPLMTTADGPAAAAMPDAAPARRLCLLVVDDVAMNREVASAFLRIGGHDVVCAESGAEAVEAASVRDFDTILMDVRMPGMDGLEATRRIRALPGARGRIPILALTAQAFAEQIEECRRAGMDDHLAKPFTPESLLGALARVLTARPTSRDTEPAAHRPAVQAASRPPGVPAADLPRMIVAATAVAAEPALPVCDLAAFGRTAAFLSPEQVMAHMQTLAGRGSALLSALAERPARGAGADGLSAAAHALAGSAGMFGFQRLTTAARGYERALATASPDAPVSSVALVAAIEASLPEMLRRARGAPEPAGDGATAMAPAGTIAGSAAGRHPPGLALSSR